MTLQEILKAISIAARPFHSGTQLTVNNYRQAANHGLMFEELIFIAKRKGATPYEIERACKGEIIGSSFETECTPVEP